MAGIRSTGRYCSREVLTVTGGAEAIPATGTQPCSHDVCDSDEIQGSGKMSDRIPLIKRYQQLEANSQDVDEQNLRAYAENHCYPGRNIDDVTAEWVAF